MHRFNDRVERPDELVEHLDDAGNVIAVVTRGEIRAGNLRHRSVGIVVTNPEGEVLIHRRALDKSVWAGWWDVAAGGIVGVGESFEDAAQRELAEELGISGVPLAHLIDGEFANDVVRAQMRMFSCVWDGPVRFPDGEVIDACWAGPDELRVRLARDTFVPDSREVLQTLLGIELT